MKKTLLALFVFLFLMASTNFAQSKGQKLPSIEIKDLSGSGVDISKYSGNDKITVIKQ